MPSLKRKLSPTDSDSDSSPEYDTLKYPSPPLSTIDADGGDLVGKHKRRRCNTIERGLAGLRLDPSMHRSASASPYPASSPASAPLEVLENHWHANGNASMDADPEPAIIFPSLIEEPDERQPGQNGVSESEPVVEDVKMKGTSWYELEKDRIVITDLDAVDEDEEDPYKQEIECHPCSSEYADSNADLSISAALLNHIKRNANFPYKPDPILPMRGNKADNAIVLYKPLPGLGPSSAATGEVEDDKEGAGATVGIGDDATGGAKKVDATPAILPNEARMVDDDAMDVEL